MHNLHIQPLFFCEELRRRAIELLLSSCLRDSPVKISFIHEIWEPYHGYPVKCAPVGVIDTTHVVLPPKALERRYYVFIITVSTLADTGTHLYREGD